MSSVTCCWSCVDKEEDIWRRDRAPVAGALGTRGRRIESKVKGQVARALCTKRRRLYGRTGPMAEDSGLGRSADKVRFWCLDGVFKWKEGCR